MTGAQSRMARSLLKLSREDLAKETNVSCGTIASFENDTSIRETAIKDIQCAFNAFGVECLPDGSVRPRSDGIKDFRGFGGCDRFFANIEKMLKEHPTDVVCMIASQNMLTKVTGRGRTNFERLEALSKIATVKCLLEDTRIYLPGTPSFEVRVLPEKPTNMISSQFAYGQEITTAAEQDPHFKLRHPVYMVIESPYHTKKVFEYFDKRWPEAKPYATPISKRAIPDFDSRIIQTDRQAELKKRAYH
jgi:transcriptional regulator with XRE-family HTH domain